MLYRLLLLLFFLAPVSAWAGAAPQLTAAEASFDFGTVMKGEKVEHTFVFHNTGTAPLVIDRVKSSCSCTASLLSDKEIPVGGSGSVQAVFDSSRFRGKVHKTLYLYSNDPLQPQFEFQLQGEVLVALLATPASLDFGKVAVGADAQLTLQVKNSSSAPLRIVNVRTSNLDLQVDWQETELPAAAETRLTVTARPTASTQNLLGKILILTDRPALGEIEVAVNGSVLRP